VLLVSRRGQALLAADCGIGVPDVDGRPAWGADVLIDGDLNPAALLIDAVGVARTVTRRSVSLAEAGAGLGGVMALTGVGRSAAPRALLGVNGAATIARAVGAWSAHELTGRPTAPPLSRQPWHALPLAIVLAELDATLDGLDSRGARRRRRVDVEMRSPQPSLARAFVEELANPLTPVLAGAAVLSASVGSLVDAGLVAGVTVASALLGGVQRLVTDRAVASLLAQSATVARVRRDGEAVTLPADLLVPGDIVVLVAGDVVPADGRILESAGLEVDESALTGESVPVAKGPGAVVASVLAERTSMVYEGTTVAAGRGRAVVVATGVSTEAGRSMASSRAAAPRRGGVESRLGQITNVTVPIALGSAVAVVAATLLRRRPLQESVSAGVGLAVAAVPEGLPFLVSAAQLAAARRLSRRGALVRNPRTVEALGRVDVLCFDKTGTLTGGHIALAAVSDGAALAPAGRLGSAHRLVLAAGLRATPAGPAEEPFAHLTDQAVSDGAALAGVARGEGAAGWHFVDALPFEPTRSYHAALGVDRSGWLLSVKGAPELVLPRCTRRRTAGGPVPLGADVRRRLLRQLGELTSRGHRVLAVAERRPPAGPDDGPAGRRHLTEADVEDLAFVGFLALADPVRRTAAPALAQLRGSRVQIMMITGDHPGTAQAIADELDLVDGRRVVTGAELDDLDEAALDRLLPQVAVIARGTPAHKVRVVEAFQRMGRAVAMTGDGANDAPAIRLADVGIALGRRGTPAARAAADVVVTDDRLETIVAALVEGRALWGSVREALGILVGGNLGEIAFTVLAAAVSGQSPLTARQLLLVNLLTDLVPALAVALRAPAASPEELLAEGPEASLGAALTSDIVQRAAATAFGAAAGWGAARLTGRCGSRSRTIALASLVGSQLVQTGLVGWRSPLVVASSVASAAVLVGVVQTPGVSQFFGCTPLGPVGWALAAGAAGSSSLAAAAVPLVAPRVTWVAGKAGRLRHPDR
jgi:magnesium-transporting ATPase (P-type)